MALCKYSQQPKVSGADLAHLTTGHRLRDPDHQTRSSDIGQGGGSLYFCNGIQEVVTFVHKLALQLRTLSNQDLEA